MKDELGGKIITKFVGLIAKTYSSLKKAKKKKKQKKQKKKKSKKSKKSNNNKKKCVS